MRREGVAEGILSFLGLVASGIAILALVLVKFWFKAVVEEMVNAYDGIKGWHILIAWSVVLLLAGSCWWWLRRRRTRVAPSQPASHLARGNLDEDAGRA